MKATQNTSVTRPKMRLNAAGRLTLIFLHSKLTLLVIIGSILLGGIALLFTPRTYNPEIVVPVVNITVSRPGSNAEEMLHQIVRPLEGLMSTIPGVDHTYGIAINDSAIVTVRFKVNENEENSLVKIYNQINSNLNQMPAGTQPPLIQSVSLYDVPLVTITFSSPTQTPFALRSLAVNILEELRSVPQTGKSWVAGSSAFAVRVWLDPLKLSAYHIPLQKIKQALISNNLGLNAGKIEPGNRKIPLRVDAELTNPEKIGNVLIGVWNAKPILLKDVAQIEIGPEDKNIRSYFAFGKANKKQFHTGTLQPAVTIAIARQKGSNGVKVSNDILKRFEIIKQHRLPKDVVTTVIRNYGEDADDAVNTLIEHLGISIIAVVIILFLFLGWREASIVMFSIPLILFLVLGIGWMAGQTINRITLFAFILSLGLLVDDSIVVIENIHRHMIYRPLYNFGRLIVTAANEIGKPTIIATFTVIFALLPMAFVTGMMGPFMGPIPFNAPLAMLISLIIAYTVIPYLAYRWLKKKAKKIIYERTTSDSELSAHSEKDGRLRRLYISLLQPLILSSWKRRLFYLSILVLLFIAMLQPLWQFIRPSGTNGPLSALGVGLKMLPDDNVNTFLIEIDMPIGTELQKTQRVAKAISQVLAQNTYVKNYQIFIGEAAPIDFAGMVRGDGMRSGSDYGQIRVNLMNKHERSIGSHAIAQKLYGALSDVRKNFPEARIKLFETPPGPPVRSQMEGALYGPDYALLQNLAKSISKRIYPDIYGMINIDTSVTRSFPEYQVILNKSKAVMSGLVPSLLVDEIATYFAGTHVGSLHVPTAREPQNIILQLPVFLRQDIAVLENLYFLNHQSELVPLLQFATLKKTLQEQPIYTRDQHKVVYVTGEMLYSSPVYGVSTATSQLKRLKLPGNQDLHVNNLGFKAAQPNDITQTQFFWEGEMRLTLDVFRDLGTAFIVALLLIYLLLTGSYRSFFIPIIIMGAIPLTLIGVFPGHWIMQQPFTATSMIGVIALAGIVVRNSLLLIDFILEHQRQGKSIESAVLEAGAVRLLPILLTALAIMLGSAIMITDPVFGGLAISLIFGAFASTLLSLFLIPLVYLSWRKQTFKEVKK